MAKRAPVDEKPYRPLLDPGVVAAALTKTSRATTEASENIKTESMNNVVDIQGHDLEKKQERITATPSDSVKLQIVPEQQPKTVHDLVEKFDQVKRMLLTRAESLALERLVNSLATRLNTQVKLSHVLRALIVLVLNAESEIDKRAGDTKGLTRPPNGDAQALQKFEKKIARVLGSAMRDAGPIR